MTIDLISEVTHARLLEIQKEHPKLTFQNKGYEYIDKSKFSKEDEKAFDEVSLILKDSVKGFSEFNNFIISNQGDILVRFQYNYSADSDSPNDPYFMGVGYINVGELLNGFGEINK